MCVSVPARVTMGETRGRGTACYNRREMIDGLSAGFAVITVEVFAMIGDRLFRRRYLKEGFQQGIKEGREEGIERGREEERRLWLDWDKRRREAEARGEEFNVGNLLSGLAGTLPNTTYSTSISFLWRWRSSRRSRPC